jgi:hypothetical protein
VVVKKKRLKKKVRKRLDVGRDRLTVREALERFRQLRRKENLPILRGLESLLSPISQSMLADMHRWFEAHAEEYELGTPESEAKKRTFFAVQEELFKDCFQLEMTEIWKRVRAAINMPPITMETRVVPQESPSRRKSSARRIVRGQLKGPLKSAVKSARPK